LHLVGCTLRMTWTVLCYTFRKWGPCVIFINISVSGLPALRETEACTAFAELTLVLQKKGYTGLQSRWKEGGKGGLIKQMRWSELNWTVSGSLPEVGFVISSDEPSFPVTKDARDSIWFGWVARPSEIQVYIDLGSFEDIYVFNRAWIRLGVKHCREFFCCPASRCIRVMKSNLMHYLSPVHFVNQPLHVSCIFVAHHQEVYWEYIYIYIYIQQFVNIVLFSWPYIVHRKWDSRPSTKKHNAYQFLYI